MLKKCTIAGLIIILPLTITYLIVKFIINLITAPFYSFTNELLNQLGFVTSGIWIWSHDQLLSWLSKFFIISFLILFIILVGWLGRWFVVHSLIHLGDSFLRKVPLIGRVYRASKDFTDTLFSSQRQSFNKVVMVPFPTKDLCAIGLVTAELGVEGPLSSGNESVSVLILGSPNPMIGFLFIYPKSEVVYLDWKADEALRYIISCGSSIPKALRTEQESQNPS